jgi:SAM-dependent methyltransferase
MGILGSRSIVNRLRSHLRVRTRLARFRFACYNLGYRIHPAPDGNPLPPADLVNLVIGTRELAWYQLGGLFNQEAISTFLKRNGTTVESFATMLDFGCGCGRILRNWGGLRGQCEIWGCDYNPKLVAWCQNSLSSIARFKVNNPDPPLDFPDGKFGLIYSYSVFTHLAADSQKPWMKELVRVLKPGGMFLLTVSGKRVAWRIGISAEQLQEMEERGILVLGGEESGSNKCSVYHSEGYMRACQPLGLELVDFMPGGVRDPSEQDMYLFRKVRV